MTKEMVILKSNILRPGEKFIITDKSTDGKFLPGSIGFLSFVKGVDQQFVNVAHFSVVITKKGKSGKERIETADMSVPIFELGLPEDELTIPGPDRRFFTRMDHVTNNVQDVREMTTYDFIGWALAKVKFIHQLNSKAMYIKSWPQSNVFNTVLELPNHFSDNPVKTKEYFARADIVEELITVLNKTESKLAKCAIGYMHQTAMLEVRAIRSLYDFYASKTTEKQVLDVLQDTSLYCAARSDVLHRLYKHNILGPFSDKFRTEATAMLSSMLYT
jgi:hypothetical protein